MQNFFDWPLSECRRAGRKLSMLFPSSFLWFEGCLLSSWIMSESVIYTWPADPGSLRLCHNIFTFYNKNLQLNQWNWRNNHDWNKSPGFFRILQKQVHIILKVSWNYLYCFWSIHDIHVPIFYLKSCKFMNLFLCQASLLPRQTKQMTELPNPFLFPSRTKEIIIVWLLHMAIDFFMNSLLNVLF